MHRRDNTVIGHVLAVLHKSDTAKDISNPAQMRPQRCVNCNSEGHPASYKGCPKAPNFKPVTKVTSKPQSLITKPPWPENPRDVTRGFAPATNAWSRTPARAVSEPAGLSGSPKPASAKSPGPLGDPHHHVDAEDGQKRFAQLAADFPESKEQGRPPNGHPTPSRSVEQT
ncbi:hypothetical protein EVAR_44575_1 [Eumeta japonica]|uniref:Zinc knuckle domain-containing protein n=1 Tax=Eumeta variegata TaxID=151549 RepID=A0A4C1XBZ8_EUMVA|nr:hypothetical protein EVAR_44575_1 [Eumeta japonica]